MLPLLSQVTSFSVPEITLPPTPADTHTDITTLLFEVFSEPITLPSQCHSNHRIPQELGTNPINVNPYWYGHTQKDEIDMLSAILCRLPPIERQGHYTG